MDEFDEPIGTRGAEELRYDEFLMQTRDWEGPCCGDDVDDEPDFAYLISVPCASQL